MSDDIEVIIFDKPSGKSLGIVTAFYGEGKKRKRIAHCYLMADEEPEISIKINRDCDMRDLLMIGALLQKLNTQIWLADDRAQQMAKAYAASQGGAA